MKSFISVLIVSLSYAHDLGSANDFLNHYPFGKSKESSQKKIITGKAIMSQKYLD